MWEWKNLTHTHTHLHVRVSQRVKMRIIGWVLVYMRRTNLFSFLFFAAAVFPTTITRRRRQQQKQQQHWNIKKFFHLKFPHSSRKKIVRKWWGGKGIGHLEFFNFCVKKEEKMENLNMVIYDCRQSSKEMDIRKLNEFINFWHVPCRVK